MRTKFKVERNIPIPSRMHSRSSKFPFAEMEIGDSFFVPCDEKDLKRKRNSVSTSYNRWKMWHNKKDYKFTTAITDKGFRVWRIK